MCIRRGRYWSLHENPLVKTGVDASLVGEWSAMIVLTNAYTLRQHVWKQYIQQNKVVNIRFQGFNKPAFWATWSKDSLRIDAHHFARKSAKLCASQSLSEP